MTPTQLDPNPDELRELSVRLHDLAEQWEVAPPTERPDLAPPRGQRGWRPAWLRRGLVPVLAGLVLVVAAVALASWLGTLGTTGDVVEDPAPGSAPALLDLVPASVAGDGLLTVTWNDVTRATDLAGLERPVDPASDDEVFEWLGRVTGGVAGATEDIGLVRLPTSSGRWEAIRDWEEELGWSLLDVDQMLSLGSSPMLLRSDTDPFTAGMARFELVTGPAADAPDPPEATPVANRIARLGEEGVWTLEDSTPVHPQGGPLYLGRRDGSLSLSTGAGMARDFVDGVEPTLAEDPQLATVAEQLTQATTTTMVLSRAGFAYEPFSDPDAPSVAPGDLLPAPFVAAGASWAVDEQGPLVTFVHVHDSGEAARRNADLLDQRLMEMTTFTGPPGRVGDLAALTGVEVDDATVVTTLRPVDGTAAHGLLDLVTRRDVGFLHTTTDSTAAPEPASSGVCSELDTELLGGGGLPDEGVLNTISASVGPTVAVGEMATARISDAVDLIAAQIVDTEQGEDNWTVAWYVRHEGEQMQIRAATSGAEQVADIPPAMETEMSEWGLDAVDLDCDWVDDDIPLP